MLKLPRFAAALLLLLAPFLLRAQTSVPPNQVSAHKDTSSLKPPAGAKIAIIEYEDLECPRCAQAFPVVHEAVKHYNIPLIECDFQIPYHHWSHDAALCAHYLKAKVSPALAEEYRREVFASQSRMSSRDDVQHFNQAFFAQRQADALRDGSHRRVCPRDRRDHGTRKRYRLYRHSGHLCRYRGSLDR